MAVQCFLLERRCNETMQNAFVDHMLILVTPSWFDWGRPYWGNTPRQWLFAVGILLLVSVVLKVTQGVLIVRLSRITARTNTKLDDAWLRVVKATAWFFYLVVGAAVAARFVTLHPPLQRGLVTFFAILFGIQLALWTQTLVVASLEIWVGRHDSSSTGTLAAAIRFVSRLVIWSILVLVVMSNLGIELTTLVAGLGVGGVAAALAVQKVLGDLFAGLFLYFDRPFDIGDFIIVGDVMGNVTKIGIRTTRINGLGGEKIVYPNGELASKYIQNFQRMTERRVVFGFGIEYGLPATKVRMARDIAQEIIVALDGVRFDRAHFKGYGASSLDFEVVYYVLSRDYNDYMDRQQHICLTLYERFEEQKIAFAFPTRTMLIRAWPPLVSNEEEQRRVDRLTPEGESSTRGVERPSS